jgi:preprotein translocase subunit SecB
MADESAQANTGSTESTDRQILLQKLYIKDLSFESPKSPEIFTSNTQANTQLNINSTNRKIDDEHVEVSLTLTIESKHNDETLFLVELSQAGVFTIRGYNDQERAMLLGSFCPNTLFPFAREAVADVVAKGGFPQLLLQPINFDALYAQAVQQRQAQAAGEQPLAVDMPGGNSMDSPAAAGVGGETSGAEGNGDTH